MQYSTIKSLKVIKQKCNQCDEMAEKVFMFEQDTKKSKLKFAGIAGVRCENSEHSFYIDLERVMKWKVGLSYESSQLSIFNL